ncbi:hypothetical protein PRIPAC_97392 [Pristionchus pacificus]|uniref:Uncharacterized protein n=1 Tax=Pristionchus pacificus TaxID=54126 RepID=A0A2A6BBY8_PRIPA|nr:hypothetical protein PRIPAC_97392 [Pristionchus pacificus]|eukprot:PDM63374.1 hypothetical protein PRIPAC_53731 [Pristionchus pacificus]
MRIYWFTVLIVFGFIGVEAPISWFRLRIELDIKVVIHCNNEPNATYNIELWEMDNNWSDQLIDKGEVKLSDHRGEISLKGQAKDSTMELCVEPYLIIRSDCSDRIGAVGYRGGHFDLYFDELYTPTFLLD